MVEEAFVFGSLLFAYQMRRLTRSEVEGTLTAQSQSHTERNKLEKNERTKYCTRRICLEELQSVTKSCVEHVREEKTKST
jgi:hypothetical protein